MCKNELIFNNCWDLFCSTFLWQVHQHKPHKGTSWSLSNNFISITHSGYFLNPSIKIQFLKSQTCFKLNSKAGTELN